MGARNGGRDVCINTPRIVQARRLRHHPPSLREPPHVQYRAKRAARDHLQLQKHVADNHDCEIGSVHATTHPIKRAYTNCFTVIDSRRSPEHLHARPQPREDASMSLHSNIAQCSGDFDARVSRYAFARNVLERYRVNTRSTPLSHRIPLDGPYVEQHVSNHTDNRRIVNPPDTTAQRCLH